MKRLIVLVAAILFALNQLPAQDGVEIFGYFESQVMGTVFDNKLEHVQSNKLRLDLSYAPSDQIRFSANTNYITYHGKKQWNILDYLSEDIVGSVDPQLTDAYFLPFEDRQYLDNAFVQFAFDNFDLTVGKQQISLGSGYVWNPTDVFNIKDVLDPTYEQPGHNAVRLDVPVGNTLNLTGIYSPEESWENSAKLFQIKGRIPRFDVALTVIETQWGFHDYTTLNQTGFGFTVTPEKRQVYGANIEGELLGLGLWAEYASNNMEVSKNFEELVIGCNYTFDFQTFLMFEYYRNTLGKSDYNEYQLNDWMRYFAAEQKAISRDQIYVLIQHPVTDFIEAGLMNITSISDGSFALVPTLNWSFSEDLDITAYANVNIGQSGTAYAQDSGSGGLIRARIYF